MQNRVIHTWVINPRSPPFAFVVGVLDSLSCQNKSKMVREQSSRPYQSLFKCLIDILPCASMVLCMLDLVSLAVSICHSLRHPNLQANKIKENVSFGMFFLITWYHEQIKRNEKEQTSLAVGSGISLGIESYPCVIILVLLRANLSHFRFN